MKMLDMLVKRVKEDKIKIVGNIKSKKKKKIALPRKVIDVKNCHR